MVFSEPVNASTLIASNLILRNSANTVVPLTISYAGNTGAATLTPTSMLVPGTAYTLTVRGGVGGITDMAGNALATNFISSFTTVTLEGQPSSIWADAETPAENTVDDRRAVELGVKFQSARNGQIKGIRFYKGPNNTGVHVGKLWTQGGTSLGSVTFTNESASGWQYQEFATPISITANTTYVVSYHTTVDYTRQPPPISRAPHLIMAYFEPSQMV